MTLTSAALAATSQTWIATVPLTASSRGVKIVRSARLATVRNSFASGFATGCAVRVVRGVAQGVAAEFI